jgi:hypothetical protein
MEVSPTKQAQAAAEREAAEAVAAEAAQMASDLELAAKVATVSAASL